MGIWRFKIPGDPRNLTTYGVGVYDSGVMTFSGELKCDYVTVSAIWGSQMGSACGTGGNKYCGSNQSCAYVGAFSGNGSPSYTGYFVVQAKDLPVTNVVPF